MQLAAYSDGFWSWLLVFARTTGLLFTMPILSAEGVPYRVRAILALFIAGVLYPVVRNFLPATSFDAMPLYILEIASQAFIGVMIGYLLQIVFAAFILAANSSVFRWAYRFLRFLIRRRRFRFRFWARSRT